MTGSIALLGQPNSGKSTIFNNLTGARQHVGNCAGKTVEKNEGSYTYKGTKYTVTDLPGSYGLSGNSDEKIITTDYIKSEQSDLTVVLVDASQLETQQQIADAITTLQSEIEALQTEIEAQQQVIEEQQLTIQKLQSDKLNVEDSTYYEYSQTDGNTIRVTIPDTNPNYTR